MYSSRELELLTRRQAPLLPLALAMIFAFCAAKYFAFPESFAPCFEIAAVFLAALCAQIFSAEKASAAFKALFFLFLLALSAAYFCERTTASPYPDWAPREANLELEMLSASENAKGTGYGVAVVREAPPYFSEALGDRVWFYVKGPHNLFKGQTLRADFIVRQNPGESDFEKYLDSQNINFTVSANANVEAGEAKFPYSLFKAGKEFVAERLSILPKNCEPSSAGTRAYIAMILGDKALLSKDSQSDFSKTGTMHIFAVSGLHVGMLAFVVFLVLNFLRTPKRIQPFLCLPILYLYVNICQAKPSAMRAFLMIAFIWVSVALLRKPKPFAGLIAALVFTLILNPHTMFDAGFELSYMIVGAILLYAVGLTEELNSAIDSRGGFRAKNPPFYRRALRRARRYIVAALCISFAATLASAPLTAAYFGYVAPLGILFSLLYVALATLVVAFAAMAIVLPGFISQYTNWAASQIMELMMRGAEFGADLDCSIDFSISRFALFAALCANIFALLYFAKIRGRAKWLLFPGASVFGLSGAYLIGQI